MCRRTSERKCRIRDLAARLGEKLLRADAEAEKSCKQTAAAYEKSPRYVYVYVYASSSIVVDEVVYTCRASACLCCH
ncbi:hypothetical protein DUNSADRAFT_18680 [Dunaliella salina]|uniref:Encoded protein n=1 Tax=Dunaliella salina TaxID=3046 RepID=A0ABQ7FZR3_DUNSA|nr:hypothetical protein DUNSADRAFT_18680 [Dunaliella salina]|eukprot:KAF5827837.1 hypothetical protein DUNSADRAFT_18680 [Dunaliella salina]